MKQQVLKLTAKQVIEGETFAMDFYAEVDRKNRSLVIGSLLCDLFRFMAKQKKFKLKGYKVNEITDIKLQIGNLSIDTAKIDKMKESSFASMLRQQRLKLKLRHAATAKKLFAELVWDIVEDMTREATKMTFEELLAQLDTEAAQEKDEKIERQIVKQFEELMSAN